jgi:hypothetical protein
MHASRKRLGELQQFRMQSPPNPIDSNGMFLPNGSYKELLNLNNSLLWEEIRPLRKRIGEQLS